MAEYYLSDLEYCGEVRKTGKYAGEIIIVYNGKLVWHGTDIAEYDKGISKEYKGKGVAIEILPTKEQEGMHMLI